MPPATRSIRTARQPRLTATALAVALACHAFAAHANPPVVPQGGAVKAGTAAIVPNGARRIDIIQSSQRAVIDWKSFNIGAREQVNFSQPSSVCGDAQPRHRAGRLADPRTAHRERQRSSSSTRPGSSSAPGRRSMSAGFIAATANISNENFMAGRYTFDQVVNRNAVIVNRGEITAAAGGLVALVAPGVENSGVIRAELGRVVLASGNAFTLDLFGDKLISFAVDDKLRRGSPTWTAVR